jgi:hypothetical protein
MQGVKTGGRKAGTPNKTSAELKAAILRALDAAGGDEYLIKVAQDDPRTFCTLVGKILPTAHTGEDGGPVKVAKAVEWRVVD